MNDKANTAEAGPVVTFGEIMLRLASARGYRLINGGSLEVSWAGSEANVAVALSNLGMGTKFVSALPIGSIGDECERSLQSHGVDCRSIVRANGRVGVFFLESGAVMRPARVIYDREHSVFSETPAQSYPWSSLLSDAAWLHVSGITPALSEETRKATEDAVACAKSLEIPVSVDLNYRRSLWRDAKQARDAMQSILGRVDYIIGNEEDMAMMITGDEDVVCEGIEEQYRQVDRMSDQALKLFPNVRRIYSSIRVAMSAEQNVWSGACAEAGAIRFACARTLTSIVDRVGSGDAFAAGVIYSILNEMSLDDGLEFSVAAGALKHSLMGDFLQAGPEEVWSVVKERGQASRIRR